MNRITINSITNDVFRVNNAEADPARASIVKAGRVLAYEHAKKGHDALSVALGKRDNSASFMAASDYKTLNERFNLGLTNKQMEDYCTQLGADCPFFIKNQPVFATGIGNVFHPIASGEATARIVVATHRNMERYGRERF